MTGTGIYLFIYFRVGIHSMFFFGSKSLRLNSTLDDWRPVTKLVILGDAGYCRLLRAMLDYEGLS